MSREMYYIDKDGKKQDAALHAELLGEDDLEEVAAAHRRKREEREEREKQQGQDDG